MKVDFAALISAATGVVGEFQTAGCVIAGGIGAAILSSSGTIFTGLCIDASCGLGFCAEHAAIAEMLKRRGWQIVAAVAVGPDGIPVPPCGRCREFMYQLSPLNLDAAIQISSTDVCFPRELLPKVWDYTR